jgi:hypothetical protein
VNGRTFGIGVGIALALCIALFVGIHEAGRGTHRPEGIAERYLAAISDTTRKGVRADALRRAGKEGPPGVALDLTSPAAKKDGKRSFRDLEVGKASVSGDQARVPYLVHQYVSSGTSPKLDGVIILRRTGDTWRVAARAGRETGEKVPSEGGPPPSSAPASYWFVALLIGVVVTLVASALINLAGRAARTAPATA